MENQHINFTNSLSAANVQYNAMCKIRMKKTGHIDSCIDAMLNVDEIIICARESTNSLVRIKKSIKY